MKSPPISVIIPCYNQGKYLTAAIDSLLAQAYPRLEIIVVNDGSTDDTDQVASTFGNRIRYLKKTNSGRSAARNTGVLAAQGEYVIFMDADDLLSAGMLQAMAGAAEEFPGTDVFVGGWRDLVDDKLNEAVGRIPIPEDLFHGILARNIGVIHGFMVRRDALANAGLFDVNLSATEDWDLWIRLAAARCQFRAAPHAIAIYRRHAESSTVDYEHVMQSTRRMLNKHARTHEHCTQCRQAVKNGWRSHFDVYVVAGGLRELKRLAIQRRGWALLARVCSLSLRYPAFPQELLRACFRKCVGHKKTLQPR